MPTPLDRTLIQARQDAGELEGVAWERGGGAGQEVVLDPRWWFPSNLDSYYWAPAWTAYFLGVNPETVAGQARGAARRSSSSRWTSTASCRPRPIPTSRSRS